MADRNWTEEDQKQQLLWAATAGEALRVLEGKWKIVIVVQLFAAKKALRFSELGRRIEGVTQKMLIQQLKALEQDGIIIRTLYPEVPPKVEYSLSELGQALGPAIEALVDWTSLKCRLKGQTLSGELIGKPRAD